jgi:hypothetical protein
MLRLGALAVWLVIIAVETAHGVLWAALLVPLAGDLPARQVGVPVGSLLVFAVAFLFIRWAAARTTLQHLGIGLLLGVLTVSFEVGLGRLVLRLPWDRITEDCDPTRGGFLGFDLLFMAVSPLLAAWVAVGSVIALEALFAGPVSGASMNPARSLVPAVVSLRLDGLWVYLTAPALGACASVVACRCVQEPGCCCRQAPKEMCS